MKQIDVTQTERAKLLELFPVLKEIKDEDLRDKVIAVWVRVWRESGVENLEDVPNEKIDPTYVVKNTVVSHTRATTNAALALGKVFKSEYNYQINFDYLIAAALLHDVDKPLVFTFADDGKCIFSEFGRMAPHGAYSFYLAMDCGVPLEVAHVAMCHAASVSNQYSGTPEGILVEFADKAVARALRVSEGEILPFKK